MLQFVLGRALAVKLSHDASISLHMIDVRQRQHNTGDTEQPIQAGPLSNTFHASFKSVNHSPSPHYISWEGDEEQQPPSKFHTTPPLHRPHTHPMTLPLTPGPATST